MIEEQSPETKTIREILPELNESYYIPCLQRDYCWSQKQIELLWDSLLRGLPLGSLLVWDAEGDGARKEPAYSFIQNYVDERGYPRDDGPQRYSQRLDFEDLSENYSLVLDGQQRLTSFYISLIGSYTTRRHGGWVSNPGAWNERWLHLNLLSGEENSEHDRDLLYEFDFRKSDGPSKSGDSYWFPVGELVDETGELTAGSFLEKEAFLDAHLSDIYEKLDGADKGRIASNLDRLWWAVNQRQAILYEKTLTDEKTARELFIRRNKGGKVLSGVDILLALLTGYWRKVNDEGGPTDAKKQIEQFTEELSSDEDLVESGFTFGKNFVLRTLLLFSGERPSFRRDGRYDGDHLREAESIFQSPAFERAIRDAFTIASTLGFHNGALSSKNVVSPIIHDLYLNGTSNTPTQDLEIHYWLATTVLNGVFGKIGSQQVLKTAREHIMKSDGDCFPANEILADLEGRGAVTRLDSEVLETLMEEVDYTSGARKNVLLTHLYDNRRAGHKSYEVDHIFPRGKLANKEFLREQGLESAEIDWIEDNRDHIANLQLLTPAENKSKSDRNFADWLTRIEEEKIDSIPSLEDYFDRHSIPSDPSLHEYRNYRTFIETRQEAIREQLAEELPLRDD